MLILDTNTVASARLQAILDDGDVFDVYWQAVDELKDTDLVVCWDCEHPDNYQAYVRELLLEDKEASHAYQELFATPARAEAESLKGASIAFWLMAFFEDETEVVPVVAERMVKGGEA